MVKGEVRLEALAKDEPSNPRGKPGGGKGRVVGPSGESGPFPYEARWIPPRAFARDKARSLVEASSLEAGLHAAKHGDGEDDDESGDRSNGAGYSDHTKRQSDGDLHGDGDNSNDFRSSDTPWATGGSGGKRRWRQR